MEKVVTEVPEIKALKDDPRAKSVYFLMSRVFLLREHLKKHKKDKHSIFGLVKLNKRLAKEVNFVIRQDEEKYGFIQKLI